jgi:hypothetical protein
MPGDANIIFANFSSVVARIYWKKEYLTCFTTTFFEFFAATAGARIVSADF